MVARHRSSPGRDPGPGSALATSEIRTVLSEPGGHARVRRLIMMGTPIKGTWTALVGVLSLGFWSASSWQLLPRSRFLDELSQGPIPPEVEVYTLAAARDWVCPLPTTRLHGAKAITLPMGHSSLVVSPEVYKRIKAVLEARSRRPAEGETARTDRDDALARQFFHEQVPRSRVHRVQRGHQSQQLAAHRRAPRLTSAVPHPGIVCGSERISGVRISSGRSRDLPQRMGSHRSSSS